MDRKEWVVVRYAKNEAEAHIIKGLLESGGIPVSIKQEAVGRVYGLTTDGLGQIRILVPVTYRENAENLLPPDKG